MAEIDKTQEEHALEEAPMQASAEDSHDDDDDYLAPDLCITSDSVKETRANMLENIKQYQRSGLVNKDLMVQRKFAREKSAVDFKDAAYARSQKLMKKRAERNAVLQAEEHSSAMYDEEEEIAKLSAEGLVGPDGAPLTDEEIQSKAFEQRRQRQEKAARRRSRSRSESMEKDASLSPDGKGHLGELTSDDVEGGLSRLEEGDEYDDEDCLSPTTRARKPAAAPGCVVHSIKGKFVQVPVFGTVTTTVPSAHKRRQQQAK